MRKPAAILLALLIVPIVAMSILWLIRGRDVSLFVDRFGMVDLSTARITHVLYEGSGSGGVLHVDHQALSLNTSAAGQGEPHVGTIKSGEIALSSAGKVFPFGSPAAANEALVVDVPAGDKAVLRIRHSTLPWPAMFDVNFMTGKTPSWKRHTFRELTWTKSNGAKLQMLWRYEQYCYAEQGWTEALMTREGSTGLIRVEISTSVR